MGIGKSDGLNWDEKNKKYIDVTHPNHIRNTINKQGIEKIDFLRKPINL